MKSVVFPAVESLYFVLPEVMLRGKKLLETIDEVAQQKTLTNHFYHLLLNSFCIQIGFQRGKNMTRTQIVTSLSNWSRNEYLYRQITLRIVGYHFSSRLTATLNLCLVYFKIT